VSAATVLAFDYAGYVAVGWLGAVGLVGLYALAVVRRGRRLSSRVPPGERRWS
jgi:hypothetical protein